MALIKNNAKVAAEIAVEMCSLDLSGNSFKKTTDKNVNAVADDKHIDKVPVSNTEF